MSKPEVPSISFPRDATILVVDDDADFLDAVTDSLRGLLSPAHVFKAESAEEAMAIFRREPIDLIVADYFMPGINGLALLSQTHKLRNRVVCILMTGHPRLSMRVRGLQDDSFAAFISKPFDVAEFSETLQGLLAKRPGVGAAQTRER